MSIAAPERSDARPEVLHPKSIESALQDTLVMLGEKGLPVFDKRDEITGLIRDNDVAIIEGETGSGKSTVTPVLALAIAQAEGKAQMGKVAVTEPRRVAAQSLYKYLEPTMGDRVGFRHGGGSAISPNTQLEFAVERTLLNDIVKGNDPLLSEYNTVIVDEIHEGTVDSAILLALLKQIQQKRKDTPRPLKIIMASATLDKDKMVSYFSDPSKPDSKPPGHIEIEGKMFEVKEFFENNPVDDRDVEKAAAQKAFEVYSRGEEEPGDMLIFMPGAREINRTIDALNELKTRHGVTDEEIEFISLMGGDESSEAMKKIYEKSTKRRVFVSTNVAETSITIPSVRVVIDSGLMRVNMFDSRTGMNGLITKEATKSNARQRKGRAGRVASGTMHYLFTKEEFDSRHDFLPPEILRNDLTRQVLLMKLLGIEDISNFDFIDHPGKAKIDQAIKTLTILGALDADGSLNETGRLMAEINAEPRFSRMLVEAKKLGVTNEVALVIGMIQNARYDLAEKGRRITDPIYSNYVDQDSDIVTRLKIWNEYIKHNSSKNQRQNWEAETKLRTVGFYKASGTRSEILRDRNVKDEPIDLSPEKLASIYQALFTGLMDNLIIKKNGRYQTISGTTGIKIDDRSSTLSLKQPDAFISANMRRTERGDILAGLNFVMNLEEIQKKLPSADEQTDVNKSSTNSPEKTVDIVNAQIDDQIKSEVQNIAKPASTVEPSNIVKKETSIQKLREIVRSWLRKLRIIK